jgi:hypothetical protein
VIRSSEVDKREPRSRHFPRKEPASSQRSSRRGVRQDEGRGALTLRGRHVARRRRAAAERLFLGSRPPRPQYGLGPSGPDSGPDVRLRTGWAAMSRFLREAAPPAIPEPGLHRLGGSLPPNFSLKCSFTQSYPFFALINSVYMTSFADADARSRTAGAFADTSARPVGAFADASARPGAQRNRAHARHGSGAKCARFALVLISVL